MKLKLKRILSFILTLCILSSCCGDIGLVAEAFLLSKTLKATDGQSYEVVVRFDPESGIPEDAELWVEPIEDEAGSPYRDYVEQSLSVAGVSEEALRFARAFDITLYDPVTGGAYQPDKSVKVSIRLLDVELDGQIEVVHFSGDADEGGEVLDARVKGTTVEFEAEAFSTFVVAGYTVDFHRGDYTYKILGGDSITLSELLEKLGVTELAIGDVKNVSFSNEELVKVEKQAGDWLLTSLAPFDTEETLTLTLKNGQSVEIRVTDATIVANGTWPNALASTGSGTWEIDSDGVLWVFADVSGEMGNLSDNYSTNYASFWGSGFDKNKVKRVVIGDGITGLANRLFNAYSKLETVKLGKDLTTLSSKTFHGCTKLTEVDFTECTQLVKIGNAGVFQGCSALTTLKGFESCAGSLMYFGTDAGGDNSFNGTAITEINLSGFTSLTKIGKDCFINCKKLTGIDLSGCSQLTTIDAGAFTGCTAVTSLDISNTPLITNLGSFVTLTGLTNLTAENSGLTTANLNDFTNLQNLDLSGSANLTALNNIPASIVSIDVSGCTGLTSLTLPSGVTTLDVSGCTGLTSLTVPNSVTTLDVSGCTGLTELDLSGCTELSALNVSGCTDLTTLDLSGFSALTSIDVSNNASLTALKLPTSVTALNVADCPNLVIFSDNTAESLPDGLIPAGSAVVCWGDCTYAMSRDAVVTLQEIFTACGITGISAADVQSVSASDASILQVSDNYMTVTNLVPITAAQTLHIVLKNGLTGEITVVKPHNPKVSSVSVVEYDSASDVKTVTYTVTVEAESDLDYGGKEYPVVIEDSTVGASPVLRFLSGSFVYAHSGGFELPTGASPSAVNEVEVTGAATAFTGFPLTAAHMYDGDTITLTYTAEVLRGEYIGSDTASVENVVTITNNDADGNPNPSNSVGDDTGTASFTMPYQPLKREYLHLDGSWAYWKVTVNPSGYTLSGGKALTLLDTFNDEVLLDADQSIDYASISIESDGVVTYDYSSYKGAFVIPDNTAVTITYRTRITSQLGEAHFFRGTAVLQNADEETIASSTAGVTQNAVVIYPSPSDVEGLGSTYKVKVYVYGDGNMQKGIEGARFILLDAGQRALEYKVGANAGEPVTFTTDAEGYATVELHEEAGDVSIEKNTGYYLEMMQAVAGYQKDNTLYSFMITDDPSYSTGGFYQYYNGDTMKVRLYTMEPGLKVSIRFSGSYTMRDDQQNEVTAVLQRLADDGKTWEEVERHPYTDAKWGTITFTTPLEPGDLDWRECYRVTEENQKPWDLPENINYEATYYLLHNTAASDPHGESPEFSVDSVEDSVSVVIDNRYEEPQLTIVKMDKMTGATLPGAEFTVKKALDNSVVKTYTTDSNGEIVITGGSEYESEVLYYVVETVAPLYTPKGEEPIQYLLPLTEERHYFYFCNDDYLLPSILSLLPEGETALDLTENGDKITIDNQREKITIPVMKLWQGDDWPKTEVVIGLYRSVEGSSQEPQPVLDNGGNPRTVTLTRAIPYNNKAFSGLPSRDESGKNYVYSIKEESIDGSAPLDVRYVQEYGVSSAGVYIVRNKPATTLTVTKEWYDTNGDKVKDETLLNQQSSVTFDVYRSTKRFTDATPDDGVITNDDMTAFVSTQVKVREGVILNGAAQWSVSINDLDKQDDLGNPYYYYVLETVPSFGSELYVVDEAVGTVTIKNKVAPERVNLTVTKAKLVDDPRPESADMDFRFTLKLSTGNRPIRSWRVYTDNDSPQNNLSTNWNGEVTFTLKPDKDTHRPESSIQLSLPAGVTATVTEAYNPEYTAATTATVDGNTADDGRTFSYQTDVKDGDVTLTYTNTLHVVCKVVKDGGGTITFESLKRALEHLRSNPGDFTSPWIIYLLEDCAIPASDAISVEAGESLTITTASKTDALLPFDASIDRDFAVVTRGEAGGSMFTNAGTLTLENICLDGGNITATGNGGLVNNTGILNLNAGAILRNSAVDGKGGAVYATGTVNIVDGVAISGNSAPSASAIYLKGTLNMTGGSITGNTGASDGAVVVEYAGDAVNLSGSPVIFNNTNAQGKAANLYIGFSNDSILNIVEPGLSEEAKIGISAKEGHMLIGEQFATAEIGQTAHLNRFINDAYGYCGKLKEGTSTFVVWDGLTLTIKNEVDPVGANPNDRFTITLSSQAIEMSSYIIDGIAPDQYTVTPARTGRTGRIILSDIKAGDEITISPLAVGDYTISEAASNYTYTLSGTVSGGTLTEITDGRFSAGQNTTITVTNTRRLSNVKLTSTMDDRSIADDTAVSFHYTVRLTEADGTAVSGFELADEITTNASGEADLTLSPTNVASAECDLVVPVGATMSITETADPTYRITASAVTMPTEGEGAAISDEDTANDNIFTFPVTDDGADVTFATVRKMVEIELRKVLENKVSKTESFTFTVTLTREDGNPAVDYIMYRDSQNVDNNIVTGDNGEVVIPFVFGENETAKSIPLTIPEGAKLAVTETVVTKTVGGTAQEIYNTKHSVNGATAVSGTTVTIASVSETDRSIVFTNTRKTNTIVVKNAVNGYSGNVVPFTYTATVTDGGENDYDANGFTDGVMTFELTKDQVQTLTVPYGAHLTVQEGFIVGYGTTVKRGSASAVEALKDEFDVTGNMATSSPLLFTNNQLIGLQLVNNTSSTLTDVTVVVEKNNIYLVDEDQTGQTRISTNNTATLDIEAGKTAILEIEHAYTITSGKNYSQVYTVSGSSPAEGYYYTINNEPSFHEDANPAILRIYNTGDFEVKGRLQYSVQDSIVTFTEQPLVSFDANGGVWTTEMDGYHDRSGDRKVYQLAVDKGEKVAKPTPDPVYPTAEAIKFLGWTTHEAVAKAAHTAEEVVSSALYDFNTPVNAPFTLHAIWARDPSVRAVTVKNGLNKALPVHVTLVGSEVGSYSITNTVTTDETGKAGIELGAGKAVTLSVPDKVKLVLSAESATAYSIDYTDADAVTNSFTINSVDTDGTVSFIAGICKITDGSGDVLYDSSGKAAVYPTLAEAFTAYDGTLYTTASHTVKATQAAVKLLVDEYTTQETAAITFPSKTMTLTTAGKSDTSFPYVGARERAAIYRSGDGAGVNCFKLNNNNSNITLTNIILDGGSEKGVRVASSTSGGLIRVENGTLTVNEGTTLRNVEFNAYENTEFRRGGAIFVKGGTLNVNAGLFSNLHARRGGAICCDTGALNITATGSIRFENCGTTTNSDTNNGGDGGAIFYSASNDLTINGGEDQANPGIAFVNCVAGSNWGDGGAIYATTNNSYAVSVQGCGFTECSARNNTGTDTGGFGGGAIGAKTVKSVSVSHSSFTACDSMRGGGAIMTYTKSGESVSVSYCSFEKCNCMAQGGALSAYQDGQEGSRTDITIEAKLVVSYCSFSNCSSGTKNGSGGAIQCYLPRIELSNTSFTDCWAGKEGGAINNYFGGSYTSMWDGSYMSVTDCRFIRCRAEDRYETTALQHYGGGINAKVKTVTVTGSYFEDCVSTLREGGALHLGGQGGNSKATITGSTFKNCAAKNGGGAVLSAHETLEISGCYFYGCGSSESNGGAVYHYRNSRGDSTQKYLTITDSTFGADPDDADSTGCNAAGNGGAIWTRAKSKVTLQNLTIDGCSAVNGGGVYLASEASADKVMISGEIIEGVLKGSITNCTAEQGSAIYVMNNATFSGSLEVSGNIVTDINSGAIHGGTLYFEGNVTVENNTCTADAVYKHDVLMQNDNVTTIYTTKNGLQSEARIGVYVPDTYFNLHGLEGQPFGIYNNSETAGSNFLDAFFNDRNIDLFGFQLAASDTRIYWGIYVCKITDAKGNTLKRTNGRDAVYQQLSAAFDEFKQVTGGTPIYVKMLLENYDLRQDTAISNFPDKADITLTTEAHTDTTAVVGEYDGKHPYRGTSGSVCTISRSNSTDALFELNNASATFRLEAVTLDGRSNKTAGTGDFRLIEAEDGALCINPGATLQYGSAANGGAIYATGATVTVNLADNDTEESVRFLNCTATGSGGAISANSLTILDGGSEKNGTLFMYCTAVNGGAVCVNGNAMSISGALFRYCHSTGEGGAVYHSKADASATISNSAFASCYAATTSGGAVSSKAGTLTVESSDFDKCFAMQNGGAISHTGTVATTLTGSSFTSCHTDASSTDYGFGGSVFTEAAAVTVNGGSFKDSVSSNHGGALYCQNSSAASEATVTNTSFAYCSTLRGTDGSGGAIYSNGETLTLDGSTSITACTAPAYSGAVHMATVGGTLNIQGNTVINSCYANEGGAIYLNRDVNMSISGSPEFSQNGYTTKNGVVCDAEEGACIYLAEDSRLELSGSPKFNRNILPNRDRILNGAVLDFVRQDIYLAGYESVVENDTNAASIYVVGELTGDTIWVWPEKKPHRVPNEQFAKIKEGVTVSDDTLSHLRNALADALTHLDSGEYLAGVQHAGDKKNIYWDRMYIISFRKIDNKGIMVPGAEFSLYLDEDCTNLVATATSADGEYDTDARGNLLPRGRVEFTSIRIGAYYMKETRVPTSFKANETVYLVLVGTHYLSRDEDNPINLALWDSGGVLDVHDAANLVVQHTKAAGLFYGIFRLENHKAVLSANLAVSHEGIVNIRMDYPVRFMKFDDYGNALPGAKFTVYTAILDSSGNPTAYEDGYPKLRRWSRDGETYPAPVASADGTNAYRDENNNKLDKGMVFFPELPLGTFYLLETVYPERNGDGRRTYYVESDRVFRLVLELDANNKLKFTLSEWDELSGEFVEIHDKTSKGYYVISNQEVVCKLTDENDNLLYVQGHAVKEGKDQDATARLFPAIYKTLEDGFSAAQEKSFVYGDGTAAFETEKEPLTLKLKALKDFSIYKAITYESPRAITFTTAETSVSKDRYVFNTTRTADTTRAEIKRAYSEPDDSNEGALITVKGTSLTLQNINLNGQKDTYNGRAIHVENKAGSTVQGELILKDRVMIQYFKHEVNNASVDIKGGAVLLDDHTTLSVDGGAAYRTAVFQYNELINNGSGSSDGGALQVGVECTVSLTNAQFISNEVHAASDKVANGGAVSMNKTKDEYEQGKLPLKNVVFRDNSADDSGGALYTAEKVYLTVENCIFTSNKANSDGTGTGTGGAIATLSDEKYESKLRIISGTFSYNSAEGSKGGAVYTGANCTVLLEAGTISGNTAKLGSAIYVDDHADVTVSGGTVTENRVTSDDGGAINMGGPNARLRFSGKPFVFDNQSVTEPDTLSEDKEEYQRNVVLDQNFNTIIRTTGSGLDANALIGVYVVGAINEELFWNHGRAGMPFGTFGDEEELDPNELNPQVFRNDRNLALYGVSKSDGTIYWNRVICKLTDENDNLLYQNISFKVNGKTIKRKSPATYTSVQDGFTAAKGQLFSKNGVNYPTYTKTSLKLKMLTDVELQAGVEYSGSRKVTFTTAEIAASPSDISPKMLKLQDYFLYEPSSGRTGEETALISRGYNGASLINVRGAGLTLAQIILDGAKDTYTASTNGGMVYVLSGGSLTIADEAVVRNSKTSGSYCGGAVYVANGGSAYVTGGTVEHNESGGDGAGIYLAKGSELKISGNPNFGGTGTDADGNITYTYGNFKLGTITAGSNGGKDYTLARQDIYIAGYAGDENDKSAASLVVSGDIGSGDGTIWVWAAESPHYKTLKQFAKYTDDVTNLDTTLKAFRNARIDSETGAEQVGSYLYGVVRADDSEKNVFWCGIEGSERVILVKVRASGASYQALAGRTFTVYTDSAMTKSAKGKVFNDSGVEVDQELENLTSGAGGAFFIGSLSYGTYYVKEWNDGTEVGYFVITIDDGGVVTVSGSGSSKITTPVKIVTLE